MLHVRRFIKQQSFFSHYCRSSLRPELYTPAYGGFFELDLEKEKTVVSLRTLVSGAEQTPQAFVLHVVVVRNGITAAPLQIDRSAVESFGGGGRVCIMARVYPAALVDDSGTRMYAFNNGTSTVRVPRLEAWSMRRAQVNKG